jgi:hypothetical protein
MFLKFILKEKICKTLIEYMENIYIERWKLESYQHKYL